MFRDSQLIAFYAELRRQAAGRQRFSGFYWPPLETIAGPHAYAAFAALCARGWLTERVIPNTYGHVEYTFRPAPLDDLEYPDSAQAVAEGWGIFWSDSRGWEIQRDDAQRTFATDADALAHVRSHAAAGSAYHQQCLAFVAAHQAQPE